MKNGKKTNPLAIVFFVLSGVEFILATIITYSSAVNDRFNVYFRDSFGEYLAKGGWLALVITAVLPAIVLALIGVYFSKKPPKEKKPNIVIEQQVSSADELKKYKELLDNGIITQEEFEAKKKGLLGL